MRYPRRTGIVEQNGAVTLGAPEFPSPGVPGEGGVRVFMWHSGPPLCFGTPIGMNRPFTLNRREWLAYTARDEQHNGALALNEFLEG